jgi:hypothetical protein
MPLANTSRARLAYLLEGINGANFGVTPGVNGTVGTNAEERVLRFTGESFDYAIKTDTSKEIRSDRMTADLIQVGAETTGGFQFELSAKEYDYLIEAALMGDWVDYGAGANARGVQSVAVTASINSTTGVITASVAPTGGDAWTPGVLPAGSWFRLTAPGDAADGAFLMVSKTVAVTGGTTITVDASTPIPGSGTRGAVSNVKISKSRLINGVKERSFSVERAFTDIAQFFQFTGQEVGKMSLDFKSGSITTGSFDFMGKASTRAGATVMPVNPNTLSSFTLDVQNAIKGVGQIWENGAPLTGTFVKSLSINLDNKLRGRDAISVFGNASIGNGTVEITGTMEVYLVDGTLYDKFINGTASSITITTRDFILSGGATVPGNGYVITLPKLKYNDAKVNAGGADQDAMVSLPFTAIIDPTTNAEIIIDRLYA